MFKFYFGILEPAFSYFKENMR